MMRQFGMRDKGDKKENNIQKFYKTKATTKILREK